MDTFDIYCLNMQKMNETSFKDQDQLVILILM